MLEHDPTIPRTNGFPGLGYLPILFIASVTLSYLTAEVYIPKEIFLPPVALESFRLVTCWESGARQLAYGGIGDFITCLASHASPALNGKKRSYPELLGQTRIYADNSSTLRQYRHVKEMSTPALHAHPASLVAPLTIIECLNTKGRNTI